MSIQQRFQHQGLFYLNPVFRYLIPKLAQELE